VTEPDWWAPLGTGQLRVTELVADEALRQRALLTEHVREIPLAELTLAGRALTAEVGHRAYTLRGAEREVIRFDVPDGKAWRVVAVGDVLEMRDEIVDVPRAEEGKVDQFHVLRFRGSRGSWVMHFTGGRLAGRSLVLVRGDEPGGPAVVSCVPAPRTRELPTARLRRRQPADVHVTTWAGEATAAEVALVELVVLSGRHVHLDYLAAGVVGAAREIAGIWRVFTPMPEPLPTKSED
jgi:hypothetical protein